MHALILYFILALGTSFLCSLLEAITLSLTYAYIKSLETKSKHSATLLKQIKERIDRSLTAILALNTIANTIGAVGVGAQVVKLWGDAYLAIASGLLTLLILILSEIIPKTLGAVYWRQLAPKAAYWIYALTWLLKIPIDLLEFIPRLIVPKDKRSRFSRDEMLASLHIGTKEGHLRERESRVIHNMLHLRNVRVKDVLTPRSVMTALPATNTVAQALEAHSPLRFSRIPVYERDLDDITGIVYRYGLLQALSEGKGEQTLQSLASPIYAIPETKNVAATLDAFIKRKEHIFLVVDEFGGTAGILTLEDAIETLLGVEIIDELDHVADMREYATLLWRKRQLRHKPPTGPQAESQP